MGLGLGISQGIPSTNNQLISKDNRDQQHLQQPKNSGQIMKKLACNKNFIPKYKLSSHSNEESFQIQKPKKQNNYK